MALHQSQMFCENCKCSRLGGRAGCNHILHLLLCVPTVGFWAIAWIILAHSAHYGPVTCQTCGWSTKRRTSLLAWIVLAIFAAGAFTIVWRNLRP